MIVKSARGEIARCPSEALYPELWRGLVGVCAPSLAGIGFNTAAAPASAMYDFIPPSLAWAIDNAATHDSRGDCPWGYNVGSTNGTNDNACQLRIAGSSSYRHKWKVNLPCTVVITCYWTGAHSIYQFCTDGAQTVPSLKFRGIIIFLDSSNGNFIATCADGNQATLGAGNQVLDTGTGTIPTNRWFTMAWCLNTLAGGTDLRSARSHLFLDGYEIAIGEVDNNIVAAHVNAQPALINARASASGSRAGYWTSQLLLYDTCLSKDAASRLTRDPHVLWQAATRFGGKKVPISASALLEGDSTYVHAANRAAQLIASPVAESDFACVANAARQGDSAVQGDSEFACVARLITQGVVLLEGDSYSDLQSGRAAQGVVAVEGDSTFTADATRAASGGVSDSGDSTFDVTAKRTMFATCSMVAESNCQLTLGAITGEAVLQGDSTLQCVANRAAQFVLVMSGSASVEAIGVIELDRVLVEQGFIFGKTPEQEFNFGRGNQRFVFCKNPEHQARFGIPVSNRFVFGKTPSRQAVRAPV